MTRDEKPDDGSDLPPDDESEPVAESKLDPPSEKTSETTPSVLEQIRAATGGRPMVSLPDPEPPEDSRLLESPGSEDPREDTGKYTVLGVLGRGGVGIVHRGHDAELGRDVAMKFLHEEYRDQPAVLHRFVEEAQIGGQLQHPGIVPVYDLAMTDGKPFFTMKLVKGKTFATHLSGRSSPAEDRRRFLAIFEQVCQTMAYAHARSVVHRDLKPANIMIGAFGEVQVVDWGMGKVLARDGVPSTDEALAAAEQTQLSKIATVRSSGEGSQSVVGSVLGTPAYMSPEQAMGDVEKLDVRTDVFSLGAILCEILTGQPPYVGSKDVALEMAAMGKLDDAIRRLQESDADPDLIALTRHCLMPAKDARPKSAEAVAERMQAYLASAERRAYEATLRAATLKRTQKLVITTSVVIGIGLAASLGFWWNAETQRGLAENATKNVEIARGREAKRAEEAEKARQDAQTHLDNFDRLSQVVRLRNAKKKEASLYPAWPDQVGAMREWLEKDAKELRDALPDLRATRDKLAPQVTASSEDAHRFLYETLDGLISEIEAFEAREVRGVEQRVVWAERVEELTITRYSRQWNDARQSILESDKYPDVDLPPQLGLVPIGENAQGLWEFYHLRSAWDPDRFTNPADVPIPEYGADGKLDMTGRGIVFVLLPGGGFYMGAQKTDPNGPNFDESAEEVEGPVKRIILESFFLSKFEMTQGQWARLTGGEYPSNFALGREYGGNPQPIGPSHPVEQVSWLDCRELLTRNRLVLPTEAQWEYGCRASSSAPWFSGPSIDGLRGFANVRDQTRARFIESPGAAPFADGFNVVAPVGTFDPNLFGLHDVHGNLWEWCRDAFGSYVNIPRRRDGLREPESANPAYIYRGGCFLGLAAYARAAYRNHSGPDAKGLQLGVRPARRVIPRAR